MNKTTTAVAGVMLLGLGNVAVAEQCFGVALAGENDCATNLNVCAGHSLEDGQKDAYINLPNGLCEKLVLGSLEAKE